MIDFHCHLDLYPDPIKIAKEAQAKGVGILSVTTTPSAWPGTHGLAKSYPVIKTALGLHPQLARERIKELPLFDRYLPETRFVGEVGLDGSPQFRASWAAQLEVFEHVLRSCDGAQDKILTIHSRRAASDVLDFLDRHTGVTRLVLHWFSGTKSELQRAVERGCWFSIGPAMLAGAKGRSHLAALPQDRVLLETDGPFGQHQNTPLQPWDVELALADLTRVWGTSIAEVEKIVRQNEIALIE